MNKVFKFLLIILIILIIPVTVTYSQSNYSWQNNKLILNNGAIKRTIAYKEDKQTFVTTSIFHKENKENFISEKPSMEFSFDINGTTYTGQNRWTYIKHFAANDDKEGEGATITLRGIGELKGLEIDITYLLYPDLPVIRKYLTFRNIGTSVFKLESLDIENLRVSGNFVHSWIYANYARQKRLGTFVGDWDDPLVVVHDYPNRQVIALGNEAPGVTKRTAFHTNYNDISIGLTHTDQNYAFRKWINPSDEWTSPKVFIATYDNSPDASNVINGTINDFTRKHMGIRLMEIEEKPIFVYNTWNPFRHDIDEKLIRELTDAAASCGIEEFVIDDGWQRNFISEKDRGGPVGDWLINETKFPNGMTTVFDYIKQKGMKPGLWMSIGSAHESAKVYADHKEWFVKDKSGDLANLHTDWEVGMFTSCFSTDWPDYIESKLIEFG